MEAYMDANAAACSCGCGCRNRVVPGASDRTSGNPAQPEFSVPSPQMRPQWDMDQAFPYGGAGYPRTGYPQMGTNMNQGGTVWPVANCPDTTAGYLEQNYPAAMAYVPWQQWQTAYAPERGLMQGTIFPDLDLPFNYGRCGR